MRAGATWYQHNFDQRCAGCASFLPLLPHHDSLTLLQACRALQRTRQSVKRRRNSVSSASAGPDSAHPPAPCTFCMRQPHGAAHGCIARAWHSHGCLEFEEPSLPGCRLRAPTSSHRYPSSLRVLFAKWPRKTPSTRPQNPRLPNEIPQAPFLLRKTLFNSRKTLFALSAVLLFFSLPFTSFSACSGLRSAT